MSDEPKETGFSIEHEARRYRELHEAVHRMGGWANFRHWIKFHAETYFDSLQELFEQTEKLAKALEDCRDTKYFNPVKNEWEPSVVQYTSGQAVKEYKEFKKKFKLKDQLNYEKEE